MFSFFEFALPLVLYFISTTSAQSCGSIFRNALIYQASYLTSPNYPSNYPSSTTCQWTITAPTGYVVELSFVAFDTESSMYSSGCSVLNDYLEVYNGKYALSGELLGRYCEKYLPANVYSSGTTLFLKFKSDFFTERTGFKLKYMAVKSKPDSTICSPFNTYSQNNAIKYSGSSGYIKSPLYGTKYPSNIQCTWVITVPEGKKVKLSFQDLKIGNRNSFCSTFSSNHDYLEIRDGKYSFSSSLKRVCGTTKPSPIYSTGRYMWIRFKSNSDNYIAGSTSGFKAKYEAESPSACGSSNHSASLLFSSYLTSPNYPSNYPSSTTCEWTITAPTGYVVELSFVAFDTEGFTSSSGCSGSLSDTLEVYDGRYAFSSELLGRYCEKYLPANVYSSGTTLLLKFKSDFTTERTGFKLKYMAVKSKPDSTICSPFNTYSQNNAIKYSGSSGYIKSPLYGTKYPSNIQCTWVITVPDGKKVKLSFHDLKIGNQNSFCPSYSSNHDYLEIRDGKYSFSSSLKRVCGTTKPSPIYSTGRYMWIRFKSNSDNYIAGSTSGFKAKYEAESPSVTGTVVGIIIAVIVVFTLVAICVCIAKRKRSPGHVNVPAPTTQTNIHTNQSLAVTTTQYPQQMGGGIAPPPPNQTSYPPPTKGSYQPPYAGSFPPSGSYPPPPTGGAPVGYPPQSSIPMNSYQPQTVPNDPPPAYPGPPPYPPPADTAQQQSARANPYPPPQGAAANPNPPYPTPQGAPANPNPPYPPPQGGEHQQSSPPYPPVQDAKQPTAPPQF